MDTIEDVRKINTMAVRAKRAGMIILGGGVVKHHIANACLMRNGAESAVYINTAQEFDGSDAGARPDEAVSWGKIKMGADSVKVRNSHLIFLLVAFVSSLYLPKKEKHTLCHSISTSSHAQKLIRNSHTGLPRGHSLFPSDSGCHIRKRLNHT